MQTLTLEHLYVTYDGVTDAVHDVSFSVDGGEIVCIVGESGSGKSTMLHSIQGLLPTGAASRGRKELFGQNLDALSNRELLAMRGADIAMIFQDTGRYMNPISKVGRQYDAFLKLHGIKDRNERRKLQEEMLIRVHLRDTERVLHAYPFELSGGMRQRVGIAMAMSLKPKLLLADEPTSALDVTIQAQVVREMMTLREKYGTTILMVTHNMGVASFMADKIGVMQNGELVEWGETKKVVSQPQHPYTKQLLEAVVELDDVRLLE